MPLTPDDLEKLMELAHLDIPEPERPVYLGQLQKVFSHLASLEHVHLEGLEASSHAFDQETVFRSDDVVEQGDLFLEANVPLWENGCFRVPKILDSE